MIFTVGAEHLDIVPEVVIVAGFTGRDRAAVEVHVAELREHGVPAPAEVPEFYPVPPHLLTQQGEITVTGGNTSGEVEIATITTPERTLVTVASDHTDRDTERVGISLSKRVCPKPVATRAWDLDAVGDHWDRLELTSWIEEDGRSVVYQSGTAAEMLPLPDIQSAIPFDRLPPTWVMLTGTLPAIGPIRPSTRFSARLHDPVTGESIELSYDVQPLTTVLQ